MTETELQELIIPKDKLIKHKNFTLGRGGYGYVCLGTLTHEDGGLEKVAIKVMITEGNVPDNVKKHLVKEACKLREVSQHDNIVKLLGVIMEQDNYGLVLELMVFGNCLTFIYDYAVVWPQNKLLIQICHQVTSAMVYLHRLTPPMLHMDLKGDNILMNPEFDAKICDFGISEWKTRTTRRDRAGTISHIAPEILNNVNIQSKPEQDVYSFGICCWEIFTGKKPYAGKSEEVIQTCVKDGQRPSMTDIGERCPDYMIDVIKRCWHQDPDARPTFHALQQELDGKCKSLRLQIFKGKKAVRRKIQNLHTLNDIKYIQTNHWDSIEQPADDPDISIDAIPMTPRVTTQLSHVSVDAVPKVKTPVEDIPPVVVKPYKFNLPKWDLTDFDKKVREILRDPLLMEMIISGHADHLHIPQNVVDLISSPKLLQKYISEDTNFKLELERSRHPVFDNIHFPKIKDAEQKGIAGQREAKENDVFRYTKYRPTKKESEKTDREKRQEARTRSMQTCSYIGKLHKSGLYQKVVKALKEPHQIKEALNDLETSSGEAEKFSIIGSDVLEVLQDPVMMQILFSQDPQALDTFMRYYPELTMKLLASNKTQYRSQGPSYQRRRSREEDPPRSRFDRDPFDRDSRSRFDRDPFDRDPFDPRSRFNRDPFDSDSDEEMRGMLPDLADLDRMPFLPSMLRSGQIDRRLRDALMADAMRKRQEQHNAVKKDKKIEKTNRKEQQPPNANVSDRGNRERPPNAENSNVSDSGDSERPPNAEATNNNQDDADNNKNDETEMKVTPMEISESNTPAGKSEQPKKTVPLSLEASIDEMSVDDTADGVILYSELDRDSEGGKMGVTEAVSKLKNIAQSKVPNLQLRLMEELPVAGQTEFNFIDYILSHFNYIFIYLTPNFKSDTLKHFQSQMCLLDTIMNKSWRVIPLLTEKNIPNAPLELQLLKPLQMWNMKSTDSHVVEMFVEIFAKTILFGREKGYATKCPSPNEDENVTSPINPATQSEVNPKASSNQEGIAVPSPDPIQKEVSPAVNVSNLKEANDNDVEPSSDEEPDLRKKESEKQSPDDPDQSSVPGIHTVTHKHAGGGVTKINLIPGANIPNMQIGNKNIMVIGAGGDTEVKVKSKSKKSKENVKLTESEEPVSKDDLDRVCSEIGKDWRRLSRKFGFSDGQSDQFYQDFHAAGTYEVMYQAMRRWIQKNTKEANKKMLAEMLLAIDRDDLSLKLK